MSHLSEALEAGYDAAARIEIILGIGVQLLLAGGTSVIDVLNRLLGE
jgi:hypothetical protein